MIHVQVGPDVMSRNIFIRKNILVYFVVSAAVLSGFLSSDQGQDIAIAATLFVVLER